jgi:hypothetical protein
MSLREWDGSGEHSDRGVEIFRFQDKYLLSDVKIEYAAFTDACFGILL